MLDDEEKDRILGLFAEFERTTVQGRQIASIANAAMEESAGLLSSTDAVGPVLRTALVINWPEKAMRTRYSRFRKMYPDIQSLSALKTAIDGTAPLDFCVNYLDIHANPNFPERNPKWLLLRALTDGFLKYQVDQGLRSEIDALRTWASRLDMERLREDAIGSLKGVGPGTVENIRLNLGYSTVKPDRHVIGVAQKVLGITVSPLKYVKLAEFIGINPRRFDMVLFEYGKLKAISS